MFALFSQSDARNFFIYIIIRESMSICVDYLCRITWGFREKGVKPLNSPRKYTLEKTKNHVYEVEKERNHLINNNKKSEKVEKFQA